MGYFIHPHIENICSLTLLHREVRGHRLASQRLAQGHLSRVYSRALNPGCWLRDDLFNLHILPPQKNTTPSPYMLCEAWLDFQCIILKPWQSSHLEKNLSVKWWWMWHDVSIPFTLASVFYYIHRRMENNDEVTQKAVIQPSVWLKETGELVQETSK